MNQGEGTKRKAIVPVKLLFWCLYLYAGIAIAISFVIGDGASSMGFIARMIIQTILLIMYKKYSPAKKSEPIFVDESIVLLSLLPAVGFFILAIWLTLWKFWYMFVLFLNLTLIIGITSWKYRMQPK